eukprot:scaffold29515_cov85-Skeletonema_dohrnii-CCMP3373.AAC.2
MAASDRDSRFISHILRLIRDGGGKVELSIAEAKTIGQLRETLRDPNLINALKWKDSAGNDKAVSSVFKKKLRQMESFINYSQNRWGPLYEGMVDITTTTPDEFDEFMSFGLGDIKYDEDKAIESSLRRKKVTKGSALDLWNKQTIRKDDAFPYFRKAESWSTFCRQFTLQAEVQQLSNVLDPNFVPTTADDALIFEKQSTFIYSVLSGHVSVPSAVTIIRGFYDTTDGQKTWDALKSCFEDEIQGDMSRKTLYTHLTTQVIPPKNQKPYTHYIAEFNGWYREHNELAEPGKEMNEDTFIENFERFIGNVRNITSCKSTVRNFKFLARSTGGTFTVQQEIAMYTQFVTQVDEEDIVAKSTARVHQKTFNANMHNGNYGDIDEYNPSDYYGTGDYYEANIGRARAYGEPYYDVNASYGEPQGRLTSTGWQGLSSDGKKRWRGMNADDRDMIIQSIVKAVEETSLEEEDTKPSQSSTNRSAMRTPVSKGSRVNNAKLVPIQDDDDDDVDIQAGMTLARAISRGPVEVNTARSTLPPAIAGKIFDAKEDTFDIKKYDPRDVRRLMSPKNAIELERKPIVKKSPVTNPSNLKQPTENTTKYCRINEYLANII